MGSWELGVGGGSWRGLRTWELIFGGMGVDEARAERGCGGERTMGVRIQN